MSRSLLALEANEKSVKAFRFLYSGGKVHLSSFSECAVKDIKPDGDFLRGLEKEHYSAGVYVLLPSEAVAIRSFSFPFGDEEKISRVIGFEAEKHLPYPVEEAVINFIVLEKKNKNAEVLAAFIRRKTLESYLSFLNQSRLKPRAVVPDLFFAAELVKDPAPFLLISKEKEVLRFCIFKKGVPRLLSARRLPADRASGACGGIIKIIEEEAATVTGIFSLNEPDALLEKAYISGLDLSVEDLEPALSKKPGLGVSGLDASRLLKDVHQDSLIPSLRGRIENAAGLALAVFSKKKILNLKERKVKADRKSSPALTFVLGVSIILLFFSSIFIRVKERENRLFGIREEISRKMDQSFNAPELGNRSGAEILSILRERTSARGSALEVLGKLGPESILAGLKELSAVFHGGETLEITALRIDGGVCFVDGRAKSFGQTEEFFQSILASDYFPEAKMGRALVDSESGEVVFRIEMVLPGQGFK